MSDREASNNGTAEEKRQPSHRVSFARINGQDARGRDILGPPREVGAIWERRGKGGEGILRFDHIPEEMRSQGGGVLFVKQAPEHGAEQRPDKLPEKAPGKDRDRDGDHGRDR